MTSSALRIRPVFAILLFCAAALAQTSKRPITHADYSGWRTIQSQQLSRDGKFLAYGLFPQEGDGEVVWRNLVTGKEGRQTAGTPPPPPSTPAAAAPEDEPPAARSVTIDFTADSRFVVFSTFPSKSDTDKAKRAKKRPEELPKGGLVVVDLGSGLATRIENVKRFQLPEKTGAWLAYLKEGTPTARTEENPAVPRRNRAKEYGSELVLRNLAGQSERTFADVSEFSLSKDGKSLVYAVSSRKEEDNGAYALETGPNTEPVALLAGKGTYKKLVWDEKQTQLTFLSDRDDAAAKQPKWKLYHWDRKSVSAIELVSASTPGLARDFVVSDRGSLGFSEDGERLILSSSPAPKPERDPQNAPLPDEQVAADLWHWKDDFIQPMQKVRAEQDRNRSYTAVFHLADRKLVQLADAAMPEVNLNRAAQWAIGMDDREYRRMVEYSDRYADSYVVNTLTGARKQIAKQTSGQVMWSPDGRFAVSFDGRSWNSVMVPEGAVADLTSKLGVKFSNEYHDLPGSPAPYGLAGFTKDGKYLLLYDRYDIWQVTPDGSSAKNLTDGAGRKDRIQFRYVRVTTDPEQRWIDSSEPLLLRAENETTRDSGFYRDRVDGSEPPRKLIMQAKNFSSPVRARDSEVYLLTASTFSEFPDLQITDKDFRELRKVTDANPQGRQLLLGSSELISYRSVDGIALQGALFKPENFDPKKKYPMLVYIYERLSQGLHRFVNPAPGTSINRAYYVSNGYLVYEPDIAYTVGYPGQSALKCVLPAVQAVVDRGYVDENAIGIQGHSWGGYQIAYMITQTNRFKAVAAGAPVANMTSAYNGIRWGPGRPRQFQYEKTQSRIGGTLWQYPMRFIENSPVFMADRVQTPVLMLHNDADTAVPWYQGIEYFLSLRRLGKEAYLFNYNGEPHGLVKRQNQRDYTIRMQQFFDHHLKGAPKPEWMERGIPYLERDEEKERYRPLSSGQ